MTGFKVDTKLFQELGELLVAKESTALVELIKNAYDADATTVHVTATRLSDVLRGKIVVSDDGLGMSAVEFSRGFLTIAGRTKNAGDRRSQVFGRRYTGEKGVGRLASHKLGKSLRIKSRKANAVARGARLLPAAVSQILAKIDWDAIEQLETLDQIDGSDAVTLVERSLKKINPPASGTRLVISRLRKPWTERMRNAFLSEAATLTPLPATWAKLPANLIAEELIFDKIPVRDGGLSDPGFQIVFGGDLSLGDQLLPDIANSAHWIAELSYERQSGLLEIAVSPTNVGKKLAPTAEGFRFKKNIGTGAGPSFTGRILQISDKVWDPAVQGIKIFMEGFRVPPYGDTRDDWLGLEQKYSSRTNRRLISLAAIDDDKLPEGLENEEVTLQGNSAYMGGLFLHRSTSTGLEMLVNREGFLPGPEFDFLTYWTKVTTDLIVRLRAMGRKEAKEGRAEDRGRQRNAASRADISETPTALRVRENAKRMETSFATIKQAVERNDFVAASQEAQRMQPSLMEITEMADQFGSEAVQWRVLASLGTELAAFVHEINAVGLQISALARGLEDALNLDGITKTRMAIRRARQQALDLADRIRRNATYLVDATSFEGRRRRTRQPLRQRFETVRLFFETRIAQKRIRLQNDILVDLKSPPVFPSELSGIFTNLLSNAVKFTDEGGVIKVQSAEIDGFLEFVMSNTGTSVDLTRSAQLFEAFRSTTERPDAVLGQGMGMGLTITRAFVQEYGGDIAFIKPKPGFATAIRFRIPLR